MKVLIIGSGAREHAIGESILKNPRVKSLYFAPGNGGTASLGTNIDINATDINSLVEFGKKEKIDLTIVGPEDPLCLGIVDEFKNCGLKIFGPSKSAAKLEASKSYSKEFMIKYNIPTANSQVCDEYNEGLRICEEYLKSNSKVVLKADGLCQGKGVYIGESLKDCEDFLIKVFIDKDFGDTKIVIEEYLEGFETSILAFVDKDTIKPLSTVKDHKRHLEGELGLNTGGMGTYSPNVQAEPYLEEIHTKILLPTLEGIQKENMDYTGLIFVGLMIGNKGVKTLEYNTRFGDPETQSILQRLDTDLLEIIEGTIENRLGEIDIKFNDKKVISLILSSGGYPLEFNKGYEIKGLENLEIKAFHGGTKLQNNKLLTNGGRVITLTAVEDGFEKAKEKVYREAKKIQFENMRYRNDIFPGVNRIYVEKKDGFENGVLDLKEEIKGLKINIDNIRIFNRYDVENLTEEEINKLTSGVFGEMPVDNIYTGEQALELQKNLVNPICIKFHDGQFDIREQGLLDTIQISLGHDKTRAKVSKVFEFQGNLTQDDLNKIKGLLINPVDQEEGEVHQVPNTLFIKSPEPQPEGYYLGFINLNNKELQEFRSEFGLAMSIEDLELVQNYFIKENRDPSETEISIIDTYWSDHCRHTTFNTHLDIKFENPQSVLDQRIKKSLENYLKLKQEVAAHKPLTLMDLATIQTRYMVSANRLPNLDISEEINACSFKSKVNIIDNTGEVAEEDYLIMFKNETHNHPTEIEPFGGASTCLGGAIRDPLSGRSYVYQAMRISGSGDPTGRIEDTIKGKLPQKKITQGAANGYSSYGNQIGLCTGFVDELYHPGFVAKRMEVGAVIGAAPFENVIREVPKQGDTVILVGGRTGRDGIGGATGSSKTQKEDSLTSSSAEVQKGNAITERKIQRLFRNPEAAKLIKRCNDFGAGGVCVAIGEIADSLEINLDNVLLKYQGLTGREIAISESQERMAVVVEPKDADRFIQLCKEENLEYSLVATVTDTNRVVMKFNGQKIVDISRDFLNTNGAKRSQEVKFSNNQDFDFFQNNKIENIEIALIEKLSELNTASKKDLIQKFDSSIGANSVLLPLGGNAQITPTQGMVSKIPTLKGDTTTCSIMTYGYNPYLSEASPYLGGYYAVVESLCKIAAIGGNPLESYLSFQEYFQSLGKDSNKWSKPLEALLGAFEVTNELMVPPIGGKDSMSGTYKELSVPPTLISFGAVTQEIENIISPELKGNKNLGIIKTTRNSDNTLDLNELKETFKIVKKEIENKNITSCYTITNKGTLPQIIEMALGNDIGFEIELSGEEAFEMAYGSFVVEYTKDFDKAIQIGKSKSEGEAFVVNNLKLNKEEILKAYTTQLSKIFKPENVSKNAEIKLEETKNIKNEFKSKLAPIMPKVIIPIFPGTNCEWDTKIAFEKEGALVETLVFKNQSVEDIEKSITDLESKIKESNILVFPGGFSLGDEPDGSGKFISSVIRNAKIKSAIEYMLESNDGLILGICNGFQGLIKSGLLPYGQIIEQTEDSPTLTYNDNLRHVARIVDTKVQSINSPWLAKLKEEEIHRIPISHGEGRIVCSKKEFKKLSANNQIAFTYIDNPNGSDYDIEGLISPCGKILGKMAHTERLGLNLYKNLPGVLPQPIIKSGVEYFK